MLGTVLMVWAGPKAWLNRHFLSNRVLVWVGLISFPLHLWHWPLLSFLRITSPEVPSRIVRVVAVLLSILLAWLTYRFIESPIRRQKNFGRGAVALLMAMIAAGSIGYGSYRGRGLTFMLEDKDAFVGRFENNHPTWRYFNESDLAREWRSECGFFDRSKYMVEGKLEGGVANSKPVQDLAPECYERDPRFKRSVLIWGDSHAQVLSTGIVKNMPKTWQVLQVASAGCAPDPGIREPSAVSQCDQTNYFAMRTIERSKPDVVVVAQATGHSVDDMEKMAKKLRALGVKKTLFLGPAPIWVAPLPKVMARHLWAAKPKRTFVGLDQSVLKRNEQLGREFKSSSTARYVDVAGVFCDSEGCLTHLGDDLGATLTTWDTEHLTTYASDYIAQKTLVPMIIAD